MQLANTRQEADVIINIVPIFLLTTTWCVCYYRNGVQDLRVPMGKASSGSESSASIEDQVLNLSRTGNAAALSQTDDSNSSDDDECEDLMMSTSVYLKVGNKSD